MKVLFARFVREDSGQDLIEYGLLAGIIGIAGALILPSIAPAMDTAFRNWGTQVYNIWEPSAPVP